jgi:hypothetical protein
MEHRTKPTPDITETMTVNAAFEHIFGPRRISITTVHAASVHAPYSEREERMATTIIHLNEALTESQWTALKERDAANSAEELTFELERQLDEVRTRLKSSLKKADAAGVNPMDAESMRDTMDLLRREIDDLQETIVELRMGAAMVTEELAKAGQDDGNSIYRIRELAKERDRYKAKASPQDFSTWYILTFPNADANPNAALTLAYFTRWYALTDAAKRDSSLPAVVAEMDKPWHARGPAWQGVVLTVLTEENGRPGVTPQNAK